MTRSRVPLMGSYKKIDDATVAITTTKPASYFPYMAVYILFTSPASFEKAGRDWAKVATLPAAGTGPFQVVDYQKDSVVRFKKFDDFWGAKGGMPVRKTIRHSRNGPIVDEVLPPAARQTGPVALKWLGAHHGGWLTALLAMNRARNALEFREALRPWPYAGRDQFRTSARSKVRLVPPPSAWTRMK